MIRPTEIRLRAEQYRIREALQRTPEARQAAEEREERRRFEALLHGLERFAEWKRAEEEAHDP